MKRNLKNRNDLVSNFIDYGELARGTSISIPVFIKDEFDTPINLSKHSIAFTVKTIQSDFDRDDSSAVITKTLIPQVPLNGEFYIELSSYDLDIEPGNYFFDICLFNESGAVSRIANGKFTILGGPKNRLVTRKFESLTYGNGIFVYLKMGTPIVCMTPTIEVNRQQERLDSLYSELANALNEIESLKGKIEENQVTIESLKEQINKNN